MTNTAHEPLAQPRPETSTDGLPAALTFFLTRAQRREVVRALRALSDDRSRALLIATGIMPAGKGVVS